MISYLSDTGIGRTLQRYYQLYVPYFGFSKKNLPRTCLAIGILITHCLAALGMIYIQNGFTELSTIFLEAGVTYTAIGIGVLHCIVPIICYAGLFSLNDGMVAWLSESLSHGLEKSFIRKWISNKSYYGIKFIDDESKTINPANVLNQDVKTISNYIVSLTSDALSKLFNFGTGMYQLWYLSSPLVFNLLSYSVTIPGFMMLVAVGYSIGYSVIINQLDKDIKKINESIRQKADIYGGKLAQIEEHAEAIALKRGGKKEQQDLIKNLTERLTLQFEKLKTSVKISFAQSISKNSSYMMGVIMSAPGVINKTVDPNNVFSIGYYFMSIVDFFTWRKDQTESLAALSVASDRFQKFEELMNAWDHTLAQAHLEIDDAHGEPIRAENLTIQTPKRELLMSKVCFDTPPKGWTVIQGPSGIGKTTLFRALAGIWPYVNGKISLPLGEHHYIPQEPYLPMHSSLLDIIHYPHSVPETAESIQTISTLMKALFIKEEVIQDLLKVEEKWQTRLSGGERQRIAIISAILKQPKLLFIDEGTNQLNEEARAAVDAVLREHLPEAIVIAIDHHAEPKYQTQYDHSLMLSQSESALTEVTSKPFVRHSLSLSN